MLNHWNKTGDCHSWLLSHTCSVQATFTPSNVAVRDFDPWRICSDMMGLNWGVFYDVKSSALHIYVSYNTELNKYPKDLCCVLVPFIYTLKKITVACLRQFPPSYLIKPLSCFSWYSYAYQTWQNICKVVNVLLLYVRLCIYSPLLLFANLYKVNAVILWNWYNGFQETVNFQPCIIIIFILYKKSMYRTVYCNDSIFFCEEYY